MATPTHIDEDRCSTVEDHVHQFVVEFIDDPLRGQHVKWKEIRNEIIDDLPEECQRNNLIGYACSNVDYLEQWSDKSGRNGSVYRILPENL